MHLLMEAESSTPMTLIAIQRARNPHSAAAASLSEKGAQESQNPKPFNPPPPLNNLSAISSIVK
jgi:hypothetical protein